MSRPETVERLSEVASRLRAARDVEAFPANRSPWLGAVRRWQAKRLARSFDEFNARSNYRGAVAFFLDDLYGEHDASWRDRDLARMMPTLVRWLPEAMLGTVADALELDWLSHVLDVRVAQLLEASDATTLNAPVYATAYREAGSARERSRQLQLLLTVGRDLESIVRKPFVYGVLKLARGPAASAGLGSLQSFLERGFAAFRQLGSAEHFLSTIERHERATMKALFAGDPKALDDYSDLVEKPKR